MWFQPEINHILELIYCVVYIEKLELSHLTLYSHWHFTGCIILCDAGDWLDLPFVPGIGSFRIISPASNEAVSPSRILHCITLHKQSDHTVLY